MTQPRSHSKRVEEPGFEPSSAEPRIPALACQARFAPFSFLISGRGWGMDGTETCCPGSQDWPSPWLRSVLPLHGGRSRPSLWQRKAAQQPHRASVRKGCQCRRETYWRGLLLQWGGWGTFSAVGGSSPGFSASSCHSPEVME